jgi:hypothetical protein
MREQEGAMLKHIGLAAVVVALVTLTSDTVHARGGARGGHFRSFNSGNSGYYFFPTTGSNVSSQHRGTSATSKSSAHSNGQTVQTTTTPSTAVTTKSPALAGTGTATTSAQPTTPTKAGVGSLHSQAQTPTTNTVTTNPVSISPFAGAPLSTDPNTMAQRTYRGLLHNAKELIKVGMYAPAAADLQRIINGAPGTRIAAEAQRLLAKLPV